MARWKRATGGGPRSQTDGRQATEVAIAADALNRMLELGRPEHAPTARARKRAGRTAPAPLIHAPRCRGGKAITVASISVPTRTATPLPSSCRVTASNSARSSPSRTSSRRNRTNAVRYYFRGP